ncbi:MAG: TonB-dependent receptor [Methylomicrobium sp.]
MPRLLISCLPPLVLFVGACFADERVENDESRLESELASEPVNPVPQAAEVELDKMIIQAIVPPIDGSSELSGASLRLKTASTLGKTLERELGVNNLSYGPGVGQPVIRGMSGPRVRVMHDGIGAHDTSSMSPDHAVAVESLLADSITIYRGPATLRYGSSAVGGMVDVKHKRIPDEVPLKPIEGKAEYRFDHNPNEHAGMIGVDAGQDNVAVHLDYFQRGSEDLRIPGAALDESAIREQFGIEPPRNSHGKVENTDSTSQGGSVGASWIGEQGHIGVSYYEMMKDYGVPPGVPGHSHPDPNNPGANAQAESVRVAMEQRRYDLEAMLLEPLPWVESLSGKLGYIDYRHDELDRGRPFTQFNNEVWESRVELGHRLGDFSTGFLGFQWQDRNFSAIGVETYVPPSHIDSFGVFMTERFDLIEHLSLELGARYDHQTTTPTVDSVRVAGMRTPVTLPDRLTHSPLSLAASLTFEAFEGGSFYFAWQQAQRAPEVQELLATGPHLSTRGFEIGRLDLSNEQSNHHELGFRFDDDLSSLQLNAYYKDVKNFIYLENQGYFFNFAPDPPRPQLDCANLQNCLPVYAYQADDAEFLGYEAEFILHPTFTWGSPHLTLFSDFVRGRFRDRTLGDVPRLPPLRFGFEVGLENDGWQSALRYTHALAQDRPGLNETETPAYDRLDLDVSYDWQLTKGQSLLLFGKASNLTDSVIRNSTSFLRSFAPEAGLSLEIGFRATF